MTSVHVGGHADTGHKKPQGMRWRYETAIERSGLKPLTRLVLATIARRADARTGMISARFMPSAASLAAATGLSERRIRDHLKLAEEAGWLTVEHRPGCKAMLALAIPGCDVAAEVTAAPDDATATPDVPASATPDVPSDGSDPLAQTVKKAQTSLSGDSLADMLAAAVSCADEREIEAAVDRLAFMKAHGEIRTTERAYLRRIIANGDAPAFVAACRPSRAARYADADYHAGWGPSPGRDEFAEPCEHGSPGGDTRNQFGQFKCPLCRVGDAFGVRPGAPPVPARAA